MSRCFPYPPPGYTLRRSSEDALIESIKLQKEKKKAKEQRKERRKERRKKKDEKRKERKEKANQSSEKYDISKGQNDKNFWANSDHLEKSGLTEEHEKPIYLRIPSTSSDSTENSTKRKRDDIPVVGSHGHGNIIRIRMASKKQNSSTSSIDEHLCSTSGRTDGPAQKKDEIRRKSKQEAYIPFEETRKFGQGCTAGTEKELVCLISKNDTGSPFITGISPVPDAVKSSIQKRELKYNKLVEMWLPPQLEDTCPDTDDLDWLFGGKNQGTRTEKRLKSEYDNMSCSSSSTLWQPHARLLTEVDVYALPFTVPFA